MSLLTVVQDVGLDVGLFGETPPTSFIGTVDRQNLELLSYINAAGEQIARRVDWNALRKTVTLVGTGAPVTFSMPADYSRLIEGNAVTHAGMPVRGGLSADEWASLTLIAGRPRYMQMSGANIDLYPYLALGATVKVVYQSLWWNTSKAIYESDNEVAIIPETVIKKFAIARWRRQKQMPYESQTAEAEQTLKDFAEFDDRSRSP
jgi:hypothetical protein